MTQEQLEQIEAWRVSIKGRQCDEDIVNAMWLAEEMWEQHYGIVKVKDANIEFCTYMMAFCMSLMEYIWMSHDIIKAITEDLNDVSTMPEEFIWTPRGAGYDYYITHMSYIACNDKGHDYENRDTFKICYTKTEAEALTAILNHANKAGHDAVTRLSA